MKTYYHDKSKFNPVRQVIRNAQNALKNLEWNQDIEIQKCALEQWNELEKLTKRLGSFIEP